MNKLPKGILEEISFQELKTLINTDITFLKNYVKDYVKYIIEKENKAKFKNYDFEKLKKIITFIRHRNMKRLSLNAINGIIGLFETSENFGKYYNSETIDFFENFLEDEENSFLKNFSGNSSENLVYLMQFCKKTKDPIKSFEYICNNKKTRDFFLCVWLENLELFKKSYQVEIDSLEGLENIYDNDGIFNCLSYEGKDIINCIIPLCKTLEEFKVFCTNIYKAHFYGCYEIKCKITDLLKCYKNEQKSIDNKTIFEELELISLIGSCDNYSNLYKNDWTEINEENWINITALYSLSELEESANMPEEVKAKIKEMMEKGKDLVYKNMLDLYKKLINKEELTKKQKILVDVLEKNGIGTLSATETINNFIHYISSKLENFDGGRKDTLLDNLAKIEDNIGISLDKEGRNKLLFISNEFINADIEVSGILYNELIKLILKFSEKLRNFNKFLNEILPLYHTLLTLNQGNYNENGKQSISNNYIIGALYNGKDLAYIKENIQVFVNTFEKDGVFEEQKSILKEQIKNKFQSKFGIIKIPEKIEEKEIETIKNLSLYLGNIADKDEEKEQIIGLILGLKLNNEWNNWREGKEIDLKSIFEVGKIELYENLAKEMKDKSFLKDWEEKDKEKLQEVNMNYIIGDVETIDLKLGNIAGNIEGLKDTDTYENEKTKKLISAYNFIKENKMNLSIGSVLARLFQGKDLTEDEKQVEKIIGKNLEKSEIEELQKKNIGTKVITFLNNIEGVNIAEEIKELNKLKIPNGEIIDIFKKLGEEFSSDSGVIPIQSDINHLSEILNKGQKKLTEEENKKACDYLEKVNEKVTQLYALESKIKGNFDKLFSEIKDKDSQLGVLVNNLNNIINKDLGKGQKEIHTTFTNDIEDVINNIRACLSCQTNGCNNDTNLSYLSDNKFFVYSKEHGGNRSIADQIVYLTKSNDEEGLFFLMDIVYGERVPDVLVGHIHNVMEKVRKLNKKEVSIFIPKSTMTSCHLDVEHLKSKLKEENQNFEIEEKNKINIIMQGIGDLENYQESLNGLTPRQSGLGSADGYEIKLIL